MGPAVMGQVYLMSQHPTGAMHEDERLEGVMGEGGIEDCGNAQNCVEVCPKDIPLTTAHRMGGAQGNRQMAARSVHALIGASTLS